MESAVKLCRDCKWKAGVEVVPNIACKHPKSVVRQDPVDGIAEYKSCAWQRSFTNGSVNVCGYAGSWWELRPSVLHLLKDMFWKKEGE